MASEWVKTTLGEIADQSGYGLVDGPFGSNLPASCYTEEGIPVIRGSNLSLGTGRFREDAFVFVSEATANRLERSLCRPLDIIFTKKGTLGQTGLIPEGGKYDLYLLSSNQMKLSVDRRVADPLYVYYFVSSPLSIAKIIRDSEATGVPKTNLAYLQDFPIALPPLPEQRAIAHVLGTLDDKIELNRRMSETLEAMARALFKSWFVDFDPVRAKAEGRETGLPSDISALFPDRLVDSELGGIPEGWEVSTVKDEFDLTMGQSPPGSTYNETGDGSVFYQGRTDFGFRFPTRRRYCTAPKRFADEGDTLVSVRAPVGDINMAWERTAIGRGLSAIRHKSGSSSFTYYAMKALRQNFRVFESEGTVFGSMSKKKFQGLKVVAPPKNVVDTFIKLVTPMDERVRTIWLESRTLTALRDALLPKLISGEVRVAEPMKLMANE